MKIQIYDWGETAAARWYKYSLENNYQYEVRLENSSDNKLRRIIVTCLVHNGLSAKSYIQTKKMKLSTTHTSHAHTHTLYMHARAHALHAVWMYDMALSIGKYYIYTSYYIRIHCTKPTYSFVEEQWNFYFFILHQWYSEHRV